MTKPRILFVHGQAPGEMSSFVQQDLNTLKEVYQVEVLTLAPFQRKFVGPLTSPKIRHALRRNDLVFGWFGHCSPIVILAKVMGKPAILVGGGIDVVNMRAINYGLVTLRARLTTLLGFRVADKVLLFSKSSHDSLRAYRGMQTAKLEVLYLGVDTAKFRPEGSKQPLVLTVGGIGRSNMQRKGIQTFVETARLTPEVSFHLVGKAFDKESVEWLTDNRPPNLNYLGYLPLDSLISAYQSASIYAQLSLHEGFGMAMTEAMACGCIPVVTKVGAIPEIVGDSGFYVEPENPSQTSEVIHKALDAENSGLGLQARKIIVNHFTIAERRTKLLDVVAQWTGA